MTKYDDLEEIINGLKERISEMTAISEMQKKVELITADANSELEKVSAVRVDLFKFIEEVSSKNDSFTRKITEDMESFTSGTIERLDNIVSEISADRENNDLKHNIIEKKLDEFINKMNAELSELKALMESNIDEMVNELQMKIQALDEATKKEIMELRKQLEGLEKENDDLRKRIGNLGSKLKDTEANLEIEKHQSIIYQHNNDRKVIIALIVGAIGVIVGIIGIII